MCLPRVKLLLKEQKAMYGMQRASNTYKSIPRGDRTTPYKRSGSFSIRKVTLQLWRFIEEEGSRNHGEDLYVVVRRRRRFIRSQVT